MHTFTLIFLLALFAGLALQLWLLQRHRSHIGSHRNRVPAEFQQDITLEDHQKAADYTLAKSALHRIDLVFGSLLLLLFTLGGGIDQVDRLWREFELDPLLAGTGVILTVFFIYSLCDLPFSLWRTFVLEKRFGFNRTSVSRYFLDLMLQTLLGLLLGIPLLWTVLWLMQEAGTYWWLAAWLVWVGFSLSLSWIYPVLIAPLFNRFTPLEEGELKQGIQRLLQQCGFASKGVFVMDGSRRSGHGNAYFTGFGKQKRIVFYDTLMEQLAQDEMEAVLAHELGHFKYHHIVKQLLLSILFALLGLVLLGWLAGESWFFQGLGVSYESNASALLLFLLTVPIFTQFLYPLMAIFSRRYEFQADRYAQQQTGAEPLIRALVKLYRDNATTLTPDPLYSAFHDSHPPAPVRVAHLSRLSTTEVNSL